MKLFNLTLIGIALLGANLPAAAQQGFEMENAIVIESSSSRQPDQLVITGRNFQYVGVVQLTLGGTPLTVQDHTGTVILAEIPADVLPGTYVLNARSNRGTILQDSMDVTIGSVGPEGPAGAEGPRGSRGYRGYRGQAGPQGAQGPAGPQGEPGLPGRRGERGFQGIRGVAGTSGADGLNCWDANGNGTFDGSEDTDGDGSASSADCVGPAGADGASCSIVHVPDAGLALLTCPDGSSVTLPIAGADSAILPELLVVAYINNDRVGGYASGVDTLIAGIFDVNHDGSVSVGDEIRMGNWPKNLQGTELGSFARTTHVIDFIEELGPAIVAVRSDSTPGVSYNRFVFQVENPGQPDARDLYLEQLFPWDDALQDYYQFGPRSQIGDHLAGNDFILLYGGFSNDEFDIPGSPSMPITDGVEFPYSTPSVGDDPFIDIDYY